MAYVAIDGGGKWANDPAETYAATTWDCLCPEYVRVRYLIPFIKSMMILGLEFWSCRLGPNLFPSISRMRGSDNGRALPFGRSHDPIHFTNQDPLLKTLFQPWTSSLFFKQTITITNHEKWSLTMTFVLYTLWLFNIAMEHGPFIVDFPIKTSIYKGFSVATLNN